ncbi:hypothetical protein BSR29_08365 [Boudabousia liubingyangii]|uniref:DUF3710 domain-containing protein n=1 Tax=Boudabousia liubingyangii TaxID=1921764 RepID=A0A1Q5PJD0_9ACTO|nr:DUF3710 domain-containing protein [Boudabousia liubingyangii]OKL45984.1 hypothetical protein BSR29_08365 [Boudabousia liubingyangii]OKL47739.1 hypothetical protein BSR28_04460 [Boudabousia liubingyangii]
MGLFSRKKSATEAETIAPSASTEATSETVEAEESTPAVGPQELKPEELLEGGFADLGVLKIRPVEGMQVNLPSENPPFEFITFIIGNSAVQISVFAAPKTSGTWEDRREQIIAAYEEQGLTVREGKSRYGTDVLVDLPVETPDGRVGTGTIRFAGASGPRWVAQFGFHGPAVDPESAAAKMIDEFLDQVRIERGNAPHPPFTPLPITLPMEHEE